jgi:hypothetical protein
MKIDIDKLENVSLDDKAKLKATFPNGLEIKEGATITTTDYKGRDLMDAIIRQHKLTATIEFADQYVEQYHRWCCETI